MEITRINLQSNIVDNFINFINKYRNHPTNKKSFNWQYSYMPNNKVITGLIEQHTVLGTQCMMPMEVFTPIGKMLSAKCENSYADESIRGKDHFSELFIFAENQCYESNIGLLWAFTPALKPYARFGFKMYENCMIKYLIHTKLPSFKNFVKNKKGISLIKRTLSYNFLTLKMIRLNLIITTNNKKLKNQHFIISKKLINNNDIELLQENILKKYPDTIFLNQSSEFITWRINNNPNINFKSIYIYNNKNLICYLNYSIENSYAHIRNFLFNDSICVKKLILFLIRYIRTKNIESFLFQGNYENKLNMAVFNTLKKLYLKPINTKGIPFVYKFKNDKIIQKSNWFINNLWTEGY